MVIKKLVLLILISSIVPMAQAMERQPTPQPNTAQDTQESFTQALLREAHQRAARQSAQSNIPADNDQLLNPLTDPRFRQLQRPIALFVNPTNRRDQEETTHDSPIEHSNNEFPNPTPPTAQQTIVNLNRTQFAAIWQIANCIPYPTPEKLT